MIELRASPVYADARAFMVMQGNLFFGCPAI